MTRVILSTSRVTLPEAELVEAGEGWWDVIFDGSKDEIPFYRTGGWSARILQQLPTEPRSVIRLADSDILLRLGGDGRWYVVGTTTVYDNDIIHDNGFTELVPREVGN